MTAKCELCHKKIDYRQKECDGSGLAWHVYCFRCYVCGVLLNEKYVNIRGDDNRLYCGSHVIYHQTNKRPICKVYYLQQTYRVVF